SLPPDSTYLIRVAQGTVTDFSNAPFRIVAPVHTFYVNDSAVQAGDWTTVAGNDGNAGFSTDSPKASIRALIQAYNLGAGDTIRVDAGVYAISVNIILNASNTGLTIEGYHDAQFVGRKAVLDRANVNDSSYLFELQGASNVTLENLSITGGQYGIYAGPGSHS